MRLIYIDKLKLQEFSGSRKTPDYAILSHRWTKQEVTFNDLCTGISQSSGLSAYPLKFSGFLRQAEQRGLRWAWIDTCCIDKTNSSELNEAINSMYRWYQNARICYVYLHDVRQDTWQTSFAKSSWFRRGWTLQELLAPTEVVFFDREWRVLGDKVSLAKEISQVTGIDIRVLQTGDLSGYSVAQKMSWAARRITSRSEDLAYCLMGIFGVNMSMLYGEGDNAFIRLQEEIIKYTDDHSIFAWPMPKKLASSGLLATHPRFFAGCQNTVSAVFNAQSDPFAVTNRGLSIKLEITPWALDTYLAYLNCEQNVPDASTQRSSARRIGIFLRRLQEDDQYVRIKFQKPGLWYSSQHDVDGDRPKRFRPLFVRQALNSKRLQECLKPRFNGLRISGPCLQPNSEIYTIRNLSQDSDGSYIATLPCGHWNWVAVIDLASEAKGLQKIALGFDFDFKPICLLLDSFWGTQHPNQFYDHDYDWQNIVSDDMKWSQIIEGSYVCREAPHDGTWALKGGRHQELKVMLLASPSDGRGSLMTFQKCERGSRLLWEFSIDSIDHPFVYANGPENTQPFPDSLLKKAKILA